MVANSRYVFWLRWTLANAIGELVGLGAVFIVGFYFFNYVGEPQDATALAGLALLVVALAVYEGAVVGLAQWLVLRDRLPALSMRRGFWLRLRAR